MNSAIAPASSRLYPDEATPERTFSETGGVRPETSTDASRSSRGGRGTWEWIGKPMGKYQVLDVLGQGAMGVVLKAFDPLIEREVAIKILAEHLATDATALARFMSEARAAGKLNHPNVMAIHGICQEGETYFLVLEYVSGGNLSERLAGGKPLPVMEATQALIDACKGVGAAHAAGFIHRDIKPANFMRASDGSIKVADFGLAKPARDDSRGVTQAGTVLGTPFFMSPEQCEAKAVDHRSDIYSLGATYYSLLTGRSPYDDSDSIPQILYQHCHGAIPDPRSQNPSVPDACSRIVARAMAKYPAQRYQSTDEMLADLQELQAGLMGGTLVAKPRKAAGTTSREVAAPPRTRSLKSHRRKLIVAAGAALSMALIGLVIGFAWMPPPHDKSPASPTVVSLPAVVPVPAGEAVKVGVLHSLTGTMATSEAPVVDAVLFAIDEVNQAGGVLGRPVKAVVADGRSDDRVFAQEAERLISREQVCTVFGCWTSASRKTVRPVVENCNHLLVYPVQFEGLESSPCIQYLGAAPNQQILPAVEWAMKTLQKKRFFLVGSDYVFPRAAHEIVKDYLKAQNAEVVGEAFVPLGSQKLEEVVATIAAAKPDMILNTINGDSNIAFFRELREVHVAAASTPTLSFSIGEHMLHSLNPAELAGDYAGWTYFESIATPENLEFVRRFREKYPRQSITDPMHTAYMGVKLWAQAVNEAQSLEPRKIRRALSNQRLAGPGGETRIDAETQYCFKTPRIGQIQVDGQFKVVWTATEPVPPAPYPTSRTAEAWQALLHDLHARWGNRWAAPEHE